MPGCSDHDTRRISETEALRRCRRHAVPVAALRQRLLPPRAELPRPRASVRPTQFPRRTGWRARFLRDLPRRRICRPVVRGVQERNGAERGIYGALGVAPGGRSVAAMTMAVRPGQPQSCIASGRPVARMPMFTTFCRCEPARGTIVVVSVYTPDLKSRLGGSFDADQLRDLAGRLPRSCRLRRRGARRFLQQGRAEILRRRLSQILRRVWTRERRLARVHGKAGKSLSKACVKALIQSGEVSQAEVDRRKRN